MRKNIRFLSGLLLAFVIPCLLLSSCKPKDSDIQAAIEAKKKDMPEMAGITVMVSGGVVTLSGEYKDETSKADCEAAVKGIKGVKNIIDNTTITPPPAAVAPVTIAADDALTKGVSDATKDYPTVKAAVKDGIVTLTGEIKRADLTKLMMSLHTLQPKKIDNQLTIK
jgi:osmotically-inducible protein OsmY